MITDDDVMYIHPAQNPDDPATPPWRHRVAMLAAAAAVVLVIGALVLVARGDDEGQQVPATVPPTAVSTTDATTVTAASGEDPVSRAASFLSSVGERDIAMVEEQLADGFVARSSFPGEPLGDPSTFASNGWGDLRYQVLTGTRYVDPVCAVVTAGQAESEVECETTMELAGHRITNTAGVPVVVSMLVTDAGIATMDSALGANLGLLHFEEWKETNWPAGVPLDEDIESFDDVVEVASAEERLAEDWVVAAVGVVEGASADFNDGDLDAFLARFQPTTEILGTAASDAPDVYAALAAGGQRFETSDCTPDGIDRGLAITCDVVVRPPSHEISGVELSGTVRMIVTAEGIVLGNRYEVDARPFHEFNGAFDEWLLTTHPDVHAQVSWIDLGESRVASAADQAVVAEYHGEFVARSAVYPLGG